MSFIWWIIGVALVIIWVLTVFDIIRRHLGPKKTAGWLLIVILIPFIGAILYWAMRKPETGEAERVEAAERDRREQAHRRPSDSIGPGV